jgi:hypothetical protein
MSHPLISRSSDLRKLVEEGYELEITSLNYLLVHNVPYVDSNRRLKRGILASTLSLAGDHTAPPETHVALFVGEQPCYQDGSIIASIQHGAINQGIGSDLVANLSFSNKPAAGYADYFAKMKRYVEVISAPARSIDPSATAQTFKAIPTSADESVFAYMETASGRVGISEITAKLSICSVGIVGLGGTGSYVLDLVAKTPVKEIRLFDGDDFLHHNAFRSPGAPSLEQLREKQKKVEYFKGIYSRMHKKIASYACHIDEHNVDLLRGLDFIFICVDTGWVKKLIIDRLIEWGIPFVDVGMGVHIVEQEKSLIGIVRVTSATGDVNKHVAQRISFDDGVEDDYRRNIQIADLNALNASLAVLKWKKHFKFYQDLVQERHSTFTVNVNMLLNQDQG